jgi:hypothetical protein
VTVLVLAHVAATITMFGVVLVVQIVHYPLFGYVGAASYTAYQAEHMARITWVVLPVMTIELGTAALLVWWQPLGIPQWQAAAGLALVILIWAATGVIQVPLHDTLSKGFDARAHRRLVATNWIRTVAWALRTALVLWMIAPMI